jgi:hypothetical protein
MPRASTLRLIAWSSATLFAAGVALASAPPTGVRGHGARLQRAAEAPRATALGDRFGLAFMPAPSLMLGPVDEIELLLEDEAEEKPAPMRFGVQRPVELSIEEGQWVDVPGGRLWRCQVEAVGSLNTRLHLGGLRLGPGESITLDAPGDAESVAGPIEGRGELGDGEAWGVFAPGAVARIEWFVPDGDTPAGLPFETVEYAHGYRDVFGVTPEASLLQCRYDPACYPGWGDLSDATARVMYTKNGVNRFCTGQLMATVAADETPYLSTAYHCISTQAEANTSNMRFFFRVPECGGSLSSGMNASGADLVATWAASDSTLLMVRGALPAAVRWVGWSTANPANGTSCLSIHHPNAYQQAISFGSKTGTSNACGTSSGPNWSIVNWTLGVTEGGSSGCGLYDASTQQLVGTLTCGTSSCTNTTGWDGYGRWDVALAAGGFATLMQAGSDDGFEPDDACAAAKPLGEGAQAGLVVKRLSPDWYAITVAPGDRLQVDATFVHGNGDVDFRVWSDCALGAPLIEATGDTNGEQFVVTNTSGSSTLLLEVFLSTDTRNDYALSVAVRPPCPEDLDGDGAVTNADVGVLLLEFGPCAACPGDFDGDGEISGSDLSLMLLAFGGCP